MLLENINPFVRQFVTGHLTKSISYDVSNMLQTFDHRLFYIISGYGEMFINGHTYPLQPGTVILFNSGTEYMWMIDDIKYYCINFDYTQASSHITKGFHPVHSKNFDKSAVFEYVHFDDAKLLNKPIVIDCAPAIENQIKLIASEYYMRGEYSSLLLSSLLKSLIISILSTAITYRDPQLNKETLLVKNIMEYIHSGYDKQISNNDISEVFHLHPVYINRIFKKMTNTSLHNYLLNCRLNAALEILHSQSTSIAETARLTGFLSVSYFIKLFKKRTGKTPSEYKKASRCEN